MGVTFDNEKQMFVFDFEHDGSEDIVKLTGDGYMVKAFGKCFYYGMNSRSKLMAMSVPLLSNM